MVMEILTCHLAFMQIAVAFKIWFIVKAVKGVNRVVVGTNSKPGSHKLRKL